MQADRQEFTAVQVGSSRSFGLVFAIVFAIVGLFPLISGGSIRIWALAISSGVLVVALAFPKVLQPLNLLWFRFGMLLARIINPIVMLIIYVVTMVPIGLLMRLAGKDLLSLKLDPSQTSYWVPRAPPGPDPKSLEEQF